MKEILTLTERTLITEGGLSYSSSLNAPLLVMIIDIGAFENSCNTSVSVVEPMISVKVNVAGYTLA